MTSTELNSEEKEDKMLNFTTNVPELDEENNNLFIASQLLESIGNAPGLTAKEFYRLLTSGDYPVEDHESITLAAIAIETMMTLDPDTDPDEEPTVH